MWLIETFSNVIHLRIMKKDKRAFLQISALFGVLCCPWKSVLKQDLIDIKLTSSFGVNKTANTYPVRLFFFSKCLANYVDSRNALKFREKCFCFLRNFVWVGRAKISLYWQEYLPSAVNVLTMLSSRFQLCLVPLKTFTDEFCSQKGPFRHLSNRVFLSHEYWK